MLLHVGDIVKMRKPHPCGNDLWRITYVGADIKMRCEKCSSLVIDLGMKPKRVKKLVSSAEAGSEA